VAQVPIGDRLILALATIDKLQETVGKHAAMLSKLGERLDDVDKRLAAIEKAIKRCATPGRHCGRRA
jgi:hypothetical protein